jgi:DNA-binding IclR family transcriptional regulator
MLRGAASPVSITARVQSTFSKLMPTEPQIRQLRKLASTPAGQPKPIGAPVQNTGTVSRALLLLSTLADAGHPVTVKEVSERMGLPPSTVHRLLQLMRAEGFVAPIAGSRQYTIGTELYRVSARIVNETKIPKLAQGFIEALASQFDEAVLFGVYLQSRLALSFVARADGNQVLKYQIELQQPLSLVWGASGKAVLAFLPDEIVAKILASEGPSPTEGKQPPDLDELQQILRVIRSRGYAVSEAEKLPGARGIAAPVFGPAGVIGSICLTSPKARMPHGNIEDIGRSVATAARELSRALGAP